MPLYKYKGKVFESIEDDWLVNKWISFKEYDSEEFLRMAQKYMNESPPDLIQANEKLWLAVLYTVKLFFLNIDVHLASHRSLSYFYDLAADKLSIVQVARRLDKIWQMAEKLHSFAYGTPAFTAPQFPDVYAEIKFFIEEFPKIKACEVQQEIKKLIEEITKVKRKDIDFSMFNDKFKPQIGDKQFHPKYKFF